MHSHGDEPLHPIRLSLMRKVGMSLSQRVIAASNSKMSLGRNQRLSPGKVSVVYNGVSTEDFKPSGASSYVRPRYGLESGGKVRSSRLARFKAERGVEAHTMFAGDTPKMAKPDLRQRG